MIDVDKLLTTNGELSTLNKEIAHIGFKLKSRHLKILKRMCMKYGIGPTTALRILSEKLLEDWENDNT